MVIDSQEKDSLREKLERRRDMLQKNRDFTEKTRLNQRAEQAEPEEQASNQNERRAMTTLYDMEGIELSQVNRALQRIEHGEYGRCLGCNGEISIERLRAKPWAEKCRVCAAAEPETSPFFPPRESVESGRDVATPEAFAGMDDETKARMLRDALRQDGRVPLQSLEISFEDGMLRLSGMLPGYEAKEALHMVVEDSLGFQDLVDDTRVERPRPTPDQPASRVARLSKSEAEELLHGEDTTTDPYEAGEKGEVLDPPSTPPREE